MIRQIHLRVYTENEKIIGKRKIQIYLIRQILLRVHKRERERERESILFANFI